MPPSRCCTRYLERDLDKKQRANAADWDQLASGFILRQNPRRRPSVIKRGAAAAEWARIPGRSARRRVGRAENWRQLRCGACDGARRNRTSCGVWPRGRAKATCRAASADHLQILRSNADMGPPRRQARAPRYFASPVRVPAVQQPTCTRGRQLWLPRSARSVK